MDKVNECMFMDMHRQIWYFANDRVFVFKDIKRAQANYRALRVLGLKQLVSYKIQDLDASGSGAHDGRGRTFLAMVATRLSTRTGTRTIARRTSTRTDLTMSIRTMLSHHSFRDCS